MSTGKNLDWDHLSCLDQFIFLLRIQLEASSSNQLRQKEDGFGEALKVLLREHRSTFPVLPQAPQAIQLSDFLQSNYKSLLRGIQLSAWTSVLTALHSDVLPLTQGEVQNLTRLSLAWSNLESRNRRIRLEGVEPFVSLLSQLLGWKLREKHTLGTESVYSFEISFLRLTVSPVSLMTTFVNSENGSAEKAQLWTLDLLSRSPGLGASGGIGINLVIGTGGESDRYKNLLLLRDDLVAVDEAVIREIFSSERYHAKFEEIVRRNLSLARLNPYNPEKPVQRPEMFFGRDRETSEILTNPSRDFVVIGARKIGKSSLLTRLRHLSLPARNRISIFLDCSNLSFEEITYKIALQVNPRRASKITLPQVPQMIRAAFSIHKRPFLLLLDEADHLVELSKNSGNWRFFSGLRELANEEYCQTVMTGYRVLYEAWQSRSTPLFNFVNPLYLSVLAKESAVRLVTIPLADLGVTFYSSALVEQIVQESGQHPSFLQFFCHELIKIVADNGRKEVLPSDVDAVRQSMNYRQFVLKPFKDNEDFTPFERWLVFSLVRARLHEFDADLIFDEFRKMDSALSATNVARAFQNLELGGLIRQKGKLEGDFKVEYTWTIPAFQVMLERTTNLDREIAEVRRRF